MRLGFKLFLLCLILSFSIVGCKKNSKTDEPEQVEDTTPPTEYFTIGQSTKQDVIARLGQPNGKQVNSDGTEVFTYSGARITGKAFIPFYFGDDRVRSHVYKFVFKNDVLVSKAADDNHF